MRHLNKTVRALWPHVEPLEVGGFKATIQVIFESFDDPARVHFLTQHISGLGSSYPEALSNALELVRALVLQETRTQ